MRYHDQRLRIYADLLAAVTDYAAPQIVKPDGGPEWLRAINLVYQVEMIATPPVCLAALGFFDAANQVEDAARANDRKGTNEATDRMIARRRALIEAVRGERGMEDGNDSIPHEA